jgi:hypothetical protein
MDYYLEACGSAPADDSVECHGSELA